MTDKQLIRSLRKLAREECTNFKYETAFQDYLEGGNFMD